MIDDKELAALDEAEKKALPGPWQMELEDGEETVWLDRERRYPPSIYDLNLIDLARNHMRALIDEVKEHREGCEPPMVSAEEMTWHALGSKLVSEENEKLRAENKDLRGALAAQDEREREAGKRCGIDYDTRGCDWPGVVAEEIILLRAELAAARDVLDKIMHQNRTRGYPTGAEWLAIKVFVQAALKRIEESGLLK